MAKFYECLAKKGDCLDKNSTLYIVYTVRITSLFNIISLKWFVSYIHTFVRNSCYQEYTVDICSLSLMFLYAVYVHTKYLQSVNVPLNIENYSSLLVLPTVQRRINFITTCCGLSVMITLLVWGSSEYAQYFLNTCLI